MRTTALLLIVAAAAVSACNIVNPDRKRTERQPAYLRYAGLSELLVAPDTVTAGATFDVSVRTFGGGCVDPGDTEIAVVGRVVELRPFDIFTTHLPRGFACPDNLALYTHTVSLRIDQTGAATIRAIGRAGPGDTAAIVERALFVR